MFQRGPTAPATPIAQPPSALAGPAATQPPTSYAAATPIAVPPANMPMPSRGVAQEYPPGQPPPVAASGAGQSPAPVAAAPAYGSQLPPQAGPQMNNPPPGSPTAPSAVAGAPPQLPAINPPLGLDGYCPVSLSEKQRWMLGDRRWGAIHRGRTYLFAGADEQRRFFADPDRYAPAASGNDIVLATEQGQTVPGTREHGVFFPERLPNHVYLFSSEATLEKFAKNPGLYANQALGAIRGGSYPGQQLR